MSKAVDEFIEQLKHEDSQARAIAAGYLASLNDVRAVPPLLETLKDGLDAVRDSAHYALERIIEQCKTTEELRNIDRQISEGLAALMEERESVDETVSIDAQYRIVKLQRQILKRKNKLTFKKDSFLSGTVKPPKNSRTSMPPKKVKL